MIVPKMTEEEIRKEVMEDQKRTIPKIDIYKLKFRKQVLKSTNFPVSAFYNCKTGSRNQVVIGFTAMKRGQHNSPNIGMYCIYDRPEGKYVALWTFYGKVIIFPPHFFDRYQQRVLQDTHLSRYDLIKRYFTNNWAQVGIEINEEIDAVYNCFEGHYKDEVISLVYATADGYCFGEERENVAIIKTIITEDMLSERQRKLFPAIREILSQAGKSIYGQKWNLSE